MFVGWQDAAGSCPALSVLQRVGLMQQSRRSYTKSECMD